MTRILVAIANHGTGNRKHLDRLLEAYRRMPAEVKIVVVSNIPKDLGPDVEVVVGVPSSNPWSLPFAHRPLFRERLNDFDLFIYSEDDTLVEWSNLQAFLEENSRLGSDEIPGFVRTEHGPDGRRYYSTCHSFFRWVPKSVVRRNGKLWAKYSNEHAACYVATREQLIRAIENGGFPDTPHEGRFDMLCSAATDVYTSGGLKRIVCLDRIDDFSLPHLPNKYIGRMGLPAEEMEWQIGALHKIALGQLGTEELINPETKLPGAFGSKFYREKPDPFLLEQLKGPAVEILVWGAGDGFAEKHYQDIGHSVRVVPLDAIMGECCQRRGLKVLNMRDLEAPSMAGALDVIVMSDVLHLLPDPRRLLEQLRPLLRTKGQLWVRVPNLNDIRMQKRRRKDARFRRPWTRDAIGADPLTPGKLREIARQAGFAAPAVHSQPSEKLRNLDRLTFRVFSPLLSPYLYLNAKAL